ncbi:Uncharacterised protein [Yersinia similis]|uniref:Uncharacterized protein n=1 Tax=Yersinia similis TaxID=367190 RepID=A0A0T9QNW0_9GAMM|nr:Uncharacterised protein [Yersinia similis]CNB63884.1 Uncharacterised protein [Yersinia similis]CNF62143.1 Uncharacterised protein [Yersinia similis]CNG64819.1 Uncharacterised protein [Yersinia similis]CNI20871.1 Uncharacterised protein [Yersinia similis]
MFSTISLVYIDAARDFDKKSSGFRLRVTSKISITSRSPKRRAFSITQKREDLVVFTIFVIAQWHDKHIDMHGIDQLAR